MNGIRCGDPSRWHKYPDGGHHRGLNECGRCRVKVVKQPILGQCWPEYIVYWPGRVRHGGRDRLRDAEVSGCGWHKHRSDEHGVVLLGSRRAFKKSPQADTRGLSYPEYHAWMESKRRRRQC
jgi:hypothetical protein